jgi:DNA-binding NarL/FixJ family response regulator
VADHGRTLGLTPRHVDILRLVARGFTDHAVGYHLGIKRGTVRNHLQVVFDRLGLEGKRRKRTLAVLEAIRRGYLTLS